MSGVAFFDMDRTLIAANTGSLYARCLRREGKLSLTQMVRVTALLLQYKLALIDMSRVSERIIRSLEGNPEHELERRCSDLFEQEVRRLIYQEALDQIAAHRSRGEPIVILSASTPYMVRPLATHIRADAFLCTVPQVCDGSFTGRFQEPICYGAGKLVWAQRYCEELGASLDRSAFYTDSYTDLPVLEVVGHPVVVNPDPRLRSVARRRGWPIRIFRRTVG